jgi:hypothetical protein
MTDAEKQLYERVIYHHRNGQLKWEKTIFNDFEAKLNEKITILLFMDSYDIGRSRLRFKSNQSSELFDVVFSKQTGFPEVGQIAKSLQPRLPKKVDAEDILSMIKSPDEIRQEKIEEILTSTESSVSDDVTQATSPSNSSQKREKNIKEILQPESILEKVKRLFIR